jgi:aminoglycoside phosphotransferase (APT) family kinase protein
MNKAATWANDSGFYKRLATRAMAETALCRSAAARAAGVATPAASPTAIPEVVRFDRIEATGIATLAQMLTVLPPLHRMPQDGLRRFDPFARILPRLARADPQMHHLAKVLQRLDQAMAWDATHVVHGDFHPGQVLLDPAGQVWVIDLDDLALAPPEADLGNLAAWMATQIPGETGAQADHALAQIAAAAPWADPRLTRHFCKIALLRRALKMRERRQVSGPGPLPSVH